MFINKDVKSRCAGSEQHDLNSPYKTASVVPVASPSAFYPKGAQSILWNPGKSYQRNCCRLEIASQRQHPLQQKARWHRDMSAAAGHYGRSGAVPERRRCRADLPGGWHPTAPPGTPRRPPAPPHSRAPPQPGPATGSAPAAGPGLSYAVFAI